ncbi:hypothetical protein ABGV42_01165 [Paenibacillus pabuli]|uniref:hypothetical protein n=1 Tax=Paenibacillus pabuli TaxID=1472 RepID=UPI00324252C5
MFICEPCLHENFTNVGFAQSRGNCEYCGKAANCYDIASKFLEPVNRLNPFYVHDMQGYHYLSVPDTLPENYYWNEDNLLTFKGKLLIYNGEYVQRYGEHTH